jgi:hypothetical protein
LIPTASRLARCGAGRCVWGKREVPTLLLHALVVSVAAHLTLGASRSQQRAVRRPSWSSWTATSPTLFDARSSSTLATGAQVARGAQQAHATGCAACLQLDEDSEWRDIEVILSGHQVACLANPDLPVSPLASPLVAQAPPLARSR